MPQMGVSVSEGTITKWLKQEGEAVAADEPLLEISTDKVDTEVPSPASGVVQQILVQEGETVDVGTKLAVIAPAGRRRRAAAQRGAARARHRRGRRGGRAPASARGAETAPGRPSAVRAGSGRLRRRRLRPTAARRTARRFVSPVVARIASEHGVDLGQVPGTGRGGRVTKKDILAFIESGERLRRLRPPPPQPSPPAPPARRRRSLRQRPSARSSGGRAPAEAGVGESFEPMNAMRRGIAEHMRRSLDTSAHVTSAIEVDMSKVVAIRAEAEDRVPSAATASTRPTSRSSRAPPSRR